MDHLPTMDEVWVQSSVLRGEKRRDGMVSSRVVITVTDNLVDEQLCGGGSAVSLVTFQEAWVLGVCVRNEQSSERQVTRQARSYYRNKSLCSWVRFNTSAKSRQARTGDCWCCGKDAACFPWWTHRLCVVEPQPQGWWVGIFWKQ